MLSPDILLPAFPELSSLLIASSVGEAPIEPASAGVMLLFAAVMCATYVGVAIERFHKTVAALCGAAVLVGLGLVLHLFEYPKIYEFLKEDLNIFGVIIGALLSRAIRR